MHDVSLYRISSFGKKSLYLMFKILAQLIKEEIIKNYDIFICFTLKRIGDVLVCRILCIIFNCKTH